MGDDFVCPRCRGELEAAAGGRSCGGCGLRFGTIDGLLDLVEQGSVQGKDAWMRVVYDRFGRLHDPALRFLTPLLDEVTEEELREGYLELLQLGALATRPEPVRVLEIGIGTGGNMTRVLTALAGRRVHYVGVDLSRTMIAGARRRLERLAARAPVDVTLAFADAHRLPFRDGDFDRVFHVGAINAYRDPAQALREMARVSRRGEPIVVVDEQLETRQRPTLFQRVVFKGLTMYEDDPRAPVHAVPPGAEGVLVRQLSHYFYAMRFTMPREL